MPFLTQGPTNWKFISIVVVLAIITAIIILSYCQLTIKELEAPSPEIIRIPEKVTEDEFTDWLTYRNEEYGFEVKYPNNWFVHDASNEIDCENILAGQSARILFSDKEIEDCFEPLTHGWFWFSVWIGKKYDEKNIERNIMFNGVSANKTIETEENEIGDSPRTRIIFNYNNFGWNINYLNNIGGDPADDNFEKIISTFNFLEAKMISEEEAVNLVKNLPEVIGWLALFTGPDNTSPATGGKPLVIVDSRSEQGYSIHVYEQLSDHAATFNWYSVNSKTGEITPIF